MALFKYFMRKDVTQEAHEIPAKREELSTIGSDSKNKQRGSYLKFSLKEKAEIARYASENGVVRAVRYFKENVKKSSIVDWKKAYEKELKEKVSKSKPGVAVDLVVEELSEKKKRKTSSSRC